MHPLSVRIITRDNVQQKEIHQQYSVTTRFPRLGLLKILFQALVHLKFR
jgi:hypothetical protein